MPKYLVKHLANAFDPGARGRGENLFLNELAKLKRGDAWRVTAIVQGGDDYRVTLEREHDKILVRCACPYFVDRGPCKHLWATLLLADERNFLTGDGHGRPVTLAEADQDEEENAEEFADEFDYDFAEPLLNQLAESPTPIVQPPTPPPAQPEKKPLPSWKEQLAALGRTPRVIEHPAQKAEWPETREVLYVLDVMATLNNHNPILEICYRDRRKDGSWGAVKNKRFSRAQLAQITDPQDRQILARLVGAKEHYGYSGYDYSYNYPQLPYLFQLSEPLPEELLPLICQTGRFYLRLSPAQQFSQWFKIEWDAGAPWEFRLEVAPAPDGWELKGVLRRGAEQLNLKEPVLLHETGFVFTRTHAARLDAHGAFEWIALLRREERVVIPYEQRGELLQELLRYPQLPPLDLPEDFRYEEIRLTPQPLLTIKKPGTSPYGHQPERLRGRLSFDYDGVAIPSEDTRRGLYQADTRRLIVRDHDFEQRAGALLYDLGFRYKLQDYYNKEAGWDLAPSRLPRAVRVLIGAGWHVEAEGKVFRSAGKMKVQVSSGIDWFELHGTLDFGETAVKLPALLAALQRGESVVKLDDGTFGVLPEEWLSKFGLLANLGKAEDDHLRFTKTQVGVLDALLAAQPEATCDAVFEQARQRLRDFAGIHPADPPASFVGELRGYQKEGLGWINFLREFSFGGCLADDMGLGKTIMVLALLEARRQWRTPSEAGNGHRRLAPSLVVVPKSLVFNWKAEAARFTPQLRVLDHTGQLRQKATEHFAEYDLVITTYGTLRNDVVMFKDMRFDYVILDEAQAIKNADTASAKAVRLLEGDHRLALSGTPIENHLGELWSLFEFLNPGMLGTASVFKLTGTGARAPEEETRKLLAHALRPFILRRTKDQVAKELPAKLEQTLFCELEPKQRKLYNELREHYRNTLLNRIENFGLGKSKIQILEALLRLRQAACHPGLIDKKRAGESSAKLDLLIPQLSEVIEEDHKALVFSQFTSLLSIVKGHLDQAGIVYEYLDGQTQDRQARVERFQNDPDCKLFLISLKAGGLGLNLTAAEYVFLLDPWWNPAVEAQAIDRAHRIGQTNRVFAYRLIARDTVEEKVLELQQTKRDLAEAIINADNSLIRNLGREDLELLLS
jgi:superfamily II DNA or RNA helicase